QRFSWCAPSKPLSACKGERERPIAQRWEVRWALVQTLWNPSPHPDPLRPRGAEGEWRRLPYRVVHELFGDRLAPWPVQLVPADQVRRHAGVQHVGIGPVLVHPAPGVAPVIEHLAAERMPADAPEVLIALRLHDFVADHDVVDVSRLIGEVVEPRLVAADAEEGVVVDIVLAAVEPVERADDVVGAVNVDLVGAAQTEDLAVPAERLLELRRMHDEMADPFDVRRAALDALVIERVAALRLVL